MIIYLLILKMTSNSILISVFLVVIVSSVKSYDIIKSILDVAEDAKATISSAADSLLDFTALAEKYGYNAEKYEVTTEDGYILTLHRMSNKTCSKLVQPPVFLMHGLLLSSDIWLDAGTNASLAYMLADECYDLWLGNVRGNYYGRQHVTLNPNKDMEFWNYCVDDNGYYDIPAHIDKVLNVTEAKNLSYIGFSQGCAEVAIACTERPEYCDKVQLFIALAPALRMRNTRSGLFRGISEAVAALDPLLSKLGYYELLAKGSVPQELLEVTCKNSIDEAVCQEIITVADSYDPGSISAATIQRIFTHFPAGTSKKTLVKYAQAFNDDDFRKFDYGSTKNLKAYGTKIAPTYGIENVTIPTVLVGGAGDHIVDLQDVYWLQEKLPNVLELKVVDRPLWNHLDVTYSSLSPTLLFPIVNEYLKKYSSN